MMKLRSLIYTLSLIHVCIYGALAGREYKKGECPRCTPVKKLDQAVGDTYISKANRCGSVVTYHCHGIYQTVYPFNRLECKEGKWISEWGWDTEREEEYTGNPWCGGPVDLGDRQDESDCAEFENKTLCKNGGFCMVEGETSMAMCFCRPGWKGRFCTIPSDNLCPRYCSEDRGQGKCVFVDNGDNNFGFKCECNEGFSGSRCMESTDRFQGNRLPPI